ncbi:MAG: zinc-binding dehydrogenase, partial [Alphaproteobacteria bacterium]
MREIRAAVLHDFNAPLDIETVRLRGPEAGEVEVDIAAVAICGSDVSYLEGGFPTPLPAVFGHEAAGRVRALGPGVRGLA